MRFGLYLQLDERRGSGQSFKLNQKSLRSMLEKEMIFN
jgi:hypothetical protein